VDLVSDGRTILAVPSRVGGRQDLLLGTPKDEFRSLEVAVNH
jgi:hypothetical protein